MTRVYLKFLQNFLADKKYRATRLEFRRLSKMLRYTKTTTNLLAKPIDIVYTSSFLGMYKEIFENEIYKFKAVLETPFITDGGSNIGLSVNYLKSLCPKAKIAALEPDEDVFQVLKSNLHSFGINDAELHQAAL